MTRRTVFSVSDEGERIVCEAKKIVVKVDKDSGECTIDGSAIAFVVLNEEGVRKLASKSELLVRGRCKHPLPETDAVLISETLQGIRVEGVELNDGRVFFLESDLKKHRINYDQRSRIETNNNSTRIFSGFKKLRLLSMTAPRAFVVEQSGIF